jgi:hypothetical protein
MNRSPLVRGAFGSTGTLLMSGSTQNESRAMPRVSAPQIPWLRDALRA